MSEKYNHLKGEKSPYLQQHATNPVNWYPWGREAIEKSVQLDRPIFLSIGYASCHWCHVMEQESFRDQEIADLLNAMFVSVKVDREELSAVDALYTECAQHLNKSGVGWPLNLVLTPSLHPFFATTYLPPVERVGMPGFKGVMEKIAQMWFGSGRLNLVEQAHHIELIMEATKIDSGQRMTEKSELSLAMTMLFEKSDAVEGGIQGAPKFPWSYHIHLLYSYFLLYGDERGAWLADKTLDKMNNGAIYDRLGGGFFRYATDERWRRPHYEKMLYDQALIAEAFLQGWLVVRYASYRDTVVATLDYVLERMRGSDYAFYSAECADTDGEEGEYYLWSEEQIRAVLEPKQANVFCAVYQMDPGGDPQPLSRKVHVDTFLETFGLEKGATFNWLFQAEQTLLKERKKRTRPEVDEKILLGWNALLAHTLCRAGVFLGNSTYTVFAKNTMEFIKETLYKNGKFFRRCWQEEVGIAATLDDYAALIRAAITLSCSGLGMGWLQWAKELTEVVEEKFRCKKGAYFQVEESDLYLFSRRCYIVDGAEPSGNALHCENLIRLHQITADARYLDRAESVLQAVQPWVLQHPSELQYHLKNLIRYYDTDKEVIVLIFPEEIDKSFVSLLQHSYVEHREWMIFCQQEMPSDFFCKKEHKEVTAYRCKMTFCSLPIRGEKAIEKEFC